VGSIRHIRFIPINGTVQYARTQGINKLLYNMIINISCRINAEIYDDLIELDRQTIISLNALEQCIPKLRVDDHFAFFDEEQSNTADEQLSFNIVATIPIWENPLNITTISKIETEINADEQITTE